MDYLTRSFLLTLWLMLVFADATAARLTILTYHDVQDDPRSQRVADAMTVSSAELVSQFAWLQAHGYTVIGLDDLESALAGRRPLPDKAVMLTFDDGYRSMYTRVYPLLKLFQYPAIVAPMVSWIEASGERVQYGRHTVPRSVFLSWQQLREMADSGLVEIASHSYDLHHGEPGNPQGNLEPAATTRIFMEGRYEDDANYRARIENDLKGSRDIIALRTGHRPRAVVWPYGSYSRETVDIARSLGMPMSFDLDDTPNDPIRLAGLHRILMPDGASLGDLAAELAGSVERPFVRVAHVDLDYVYDPDPAQQEANLGRLLDRIQSLGINTVFLQAFADPDGDGNADALYFPNRHLPMRADLFNRVAWQLFTRSHVRVYAWMPVLAFALPDGDPLRDRRVQASGPIAVGEDRGYQRLSPFDGQARRVITEIYEDLAKHAHFQGLLFHDDAYLGDFEDAGPAALRVYSEEWGLPASVAGIRQRPDLEARWTRLKTQWLIDWTRTLADRVRRFRPSIKTARNLYAATVLDPAAEAWFAQSLPAFLEAYDYTAIMAMPFMEGAPRPEDWLRRLVRRVHAVDGGAERTIFELQARDWRSGTPIDSDRLRRQMRLLEVMGIRHFGYYPDDFVSGHPVIEVIRPEISLATYPYPRP